MRRDAPFGYAATASPAPSQDPPTRPLFDGPPATSEPRRALTSRARCSTRHRRATLLACRTQRREPSFRRERNEASIGSQQVASNPAILTPPAPTKNQPQPDRDSGSVEEDVAAFGNGRPGREYPRFDGGTIDFPVGGCSGEAITMTYGLSPEDFLDARQAIPTVDQLAQLGLMHSRAEAIRYESCMVGRGYSVESPIEVYSALAPDLERTAAGEVVDLAEREKDLLRADSGCRRESGVNAAILKNATQTYRDWLHRNPHVFPRISSVVDEALSQPS